MLAHKAEDEGIMNKFCSQNLKDHFHFPCTQVIILNTCISIFFLIGHEQKWIEDEAQVKQDNLLLFPLSLVFTSFVHTVSSHRKYQLCVIAIITIQYNSLQLEKAEIHVYTMYQSRAFSSCDKNLCCFNTVLLKTCYYQYWCVLSIMLLVVYCRYYMCGGYEWWSSTHWLQLCP